MARKEGLQVNISHHMKTLVTKRRLELERQDGVYRSESAYVLALIKKDLGLAGHNTATSAVEEFLAGGEAHEQAVAPPKGRK